MKNNINNLHFKISKLYFRNNCDEFSEKIKKEKDYHNKYLKYKQKYLYLKQK